ncbi:MAG: hypothetical protein ACE14P_05980 [Methanotrichaceae archaeon]
MLNNAGMRSGNMPLELQEKVDKQLQEFMAIIDATTEDRHLQKGIVRSQLPCSMVVILDKESLFVAGQFSTRNRFSTYIYTPESVWSRQKINSSAQWEFGFEDPFIILFPAGLLDQKTDQRYEELKKIANEHIDSEFSRFIGLLSLLRTRPIFGPAPPAIENQLALLLMPINEDGRKNYNTIVKAARESGMITDTAEDIRVGRSAVRELWISLNKARIIIADLTGPDPGVMYGLGIAHTVGKETILISPQGSNYLVDIPKTQVIEYEDSDEGRMVLEQELFRTLSSIMQPIEE